MIAHLDTTEVAPGAGVKPHIVHYEGGDLVCGTVDGKPVAMSTAKLPALNDLVGEDLVCSDGTTLLGADDKAGVAEIMTAAEYLLAHPEIAHGKIRIGFTPDEEVGRGVDFFDCVMPTRNARHGHLFTHNGILNIMNAKYQTDDRPIEEGCQCPTCRRFSRAYLRHLLKSGEMLSQRLLVMHNLWFYNHLMQEIRDALDNGTFEAYRAEYSEKMSKRI